MNEKQKRATEKVLSVGGESQKQSDNGKITKSTKSVGKLHKQESGIPAVQGVREDAQKALEEEFPLLLQNAIHKAQIEALALHQISTTVRENTLAQMRQSDVQRDIAKTGQDILNLANLMENPQILEDYLALNGINLKAKEVSEFANKQSEETEEFDAENFSKGEDLPPDMTAKSWATLTQEITKRYSS